MKKDQEIKVRFSQKEKERLAKMKAETGIDMATFIRATAIKELRKQGY